MSTLVWSCATLAVMFVPLLEAIAAQAIRKIKAFDAAQGLANTAWAFSKLGYSDHPLRAALSSASIPKLTAFCPQGLANTAWSLSGLLLDALPLRQAISSASIRTISAFA